MMPTTRARPAATRNVCNETLATRGYSNLRPADGYALLALGSEGATTSQLGARLGITKQAAAKISIRLEQAGYLCRSSHPSDARAQLLHRTARGAELLETAADVQRQIEQDWARTVGARKVTEMRAALESVLQQAPQDTPLTRLW